MSLHYVCGCGRVMRPLKNGAVVLETAEWGPYKLWRSDLWGCPECGNKVYAGFPIQGYAEHYQPEFESRLEIARKTEHFIEARHRGQEQD